MPPSRSTKVNPSMLDVARYAGVSIATVSNVINRPEKVTKATAIRVRAAIEELGFVRNDAARSLAVGSSNSVGFVLADIANSLFVDLATGARTRAVETEMPLLLGNTGCDLAQQEEYLDLFDEARVAGMLLAPMEDSAAGIRRMRSHGRQIVLINYHQKDEDCCTVLVDNEMVGYLAARHLIDLGRKRLAFVAGHEFFQPVHDRRIGVKRAIAETNGEVELEELDTAALLTEDGRRMAELLLMRRREFMPDGIIAVSDAIGNGIIEEIVSHSDLRVPQDLSVIGCEDDRSTASGPVLLTTVKPPGVEMGETAMELLLEEMSAAPGTHQHRTVVLQPTLVQRASTSVAAAELSAGVF